MKESVSYAPSRADLTGSPAFAASSASDKTSIKSLVAVTLGNGLEIYDFAVYSFFSVIIGHLFFPASNDYVSLLLAVATFGVGFVMRPLGSMVLGNYADRHGRKAAMTLIMGLMSLGVMLVAFAPTYSQAGILAPIALIAGRLLQGFSAGGEVGAATTWLMEAGGTARRGERVSWQMTSQGGAALLGAAMGAGLSHYLSEEQLYDWGWRIPFILGLAIMPVGLYIRRQLPETHSTSPTTALANPALTLWREHRKVLLLGIFAGIKGTTTFYIIIYYMPAYMVNTMHMPASISYWISLTAALLTLLVPFWGGRLADRLPRRKPILIACALLSLVLIWPIFATIMYGLPLWYTIVLIALDQVLANISAVAMFLLILESFPRPVRACGMAMVYAISVSLFGGFAQFNVTWLLKVTNQPMAPAWYLMFCAIVSLCALIAWRERNVLPDKEKETLC
ncbi:MFS transporter [Enterobacteriaceae bacterium H11S18]|uniref:MFS transporter n=1 Tax=Dryocola clanedunensis TaxID=2925396 RepID=UPI0022F00CDE|nr:MFS transporter [Dryocola clanedunensis]MCT4705369.1 MFS transporter [Dryocola clanedunensis]MCT4709741.1 MFS transporter [Dryocola clanedunensis]